jgi:hypothetical protein
MKFWEKFTLYANLDSGLELVKRISTVLIWWNYDDTDKFDPPIQITSQIISFHCFKYITDRMFWPHEESWIQNTSQSKDKEPTYTNVSSTNNIKSIMRFYLNILSFQFSIGGITPLSIKFFWERIYAGCHVLDQDGNMNADATNQPLHWINR